MDVFKESKYRKQYNAQYKEALKLFQCPYTEYYIDTNYGKSYVLRFGDAQKPPLVLLHGMTMCSVMWYPNVKMWTSHFCVYTIDIIGDIGKSIPNQMIIQQEQAVEWLKQVVDALHLPQFHLAGHSIGGYISLRFTIAHPKRVNRLALFAPAAAFHRLHWKFFYFAFPGVLFQTEKWIDRAFRSLSAKGLPFEPEYHQLILAGYYNALPLLRLYPLKIEAELLSTIKQPVLLMVGEQEVIYPAQQVLDYAKAAVPNIDAVIVQQANHTLTMEYADNINEYTLQFLLR